MLFERNIVDKPSLPIRLVSIAKKSEFQDEPLSS